MADRFTPDEIDQITPEVRVEEIDAIKGFFVGDLPAIKNLLAASTWIKQLLGTGV